MSNRKKTRKDIADVYYCCWTMIKNILENPFCTLQRKRISHSRNNLYEGEQVKLKIIIGN